MKVFDWGKLKEFVAEENPAEVSVGILEDWLSTSSVVYRKGKYLEDRRAYTHSDWATPGFKAEMDNGDTAEIAAYREDTEEDLEATKREAEEKRDNRRKLIERD